MPNNWFDFYNQTYFMFKKWEHMHVNRWATKQFFPIIIVAHSWNSTFIDVHHSSEYVIKNQSSIVNSLDMVKDNLLIIQMQNGIKCLFSILYCKRNNLL